MASHGSCKNLLLGVFKRPKRKESSHVDHTPEEEKKKDSGSHIRERRFQKDLWKEAYEKIRKGNRGLVESYEEGLLKLGLECDKEQMRVNPCDSRTSQIQQLANQRIKEIGDRQLVVKIGGEEKVVRGEARQLAQRIVHGIVNVKDVISAAISSEPHAGLAWAGVLVILPVSTRSAIWSYKNRSNIACSKNVASTFAPTNKLSFLLQPCYLPRRLMVRDTNRSS
ncbi:hypothetical protein BDV41DRAFT_530490 [Aspergillus transmontanensis]|uniref:NWD NACHT-NTPase N-terminal domain-containing protein n=1 Tax=Aspergillus transmontanensis TaxID=1034304 RepID=A0A5N6W462_9EURO|nr:hypothetical protein BDV41DRAFT_530490 [Aspergillus transmontanensis]